MKADIHIHSNYSDSSDTIEELLEKAKGLDLIALTDHNTLKGNAHLQKIYQNFDGIVLCGLELTVAFRKQEVHLLAYFPITTSFDLEMYDDLKRLVAQYEIDKINQIKAIITNIQKDYPICFKEFLEYHHALGKTNNFNRVHIGNYLVYKGLVDSLDEAFKTFINKNSIYYVEKENIDLTEALEVISKCGGFYSIAHLKQYHKSDEWIIALLDTLSQYNLYFGVELLHYDHEIEDVIRYERLCKKYEDRIIYTCGSDSHGKNKVNQIGEPYQKALKEQLDKKHQLLSDKLTLFVQNYFHL